MTRTGGILTLLLKVLAARSMLSDNVGHMLALLDLLGSNNPCQVKVQ